MVLKRLKMKDSSHEGAYRLRCVPELGASKNRTTVQHSRAFALEPDSS